MKIKIDNKTYEQLKFKGSVMRNIMVVSDTMQKAQEEGKFGVEEFDSITETIVKAFDAKFTTDDLLDEFEYFEILEIFKKIGIEVNKKTQSKFDTLSKN